MTKNELINCIGQHAGSLRSHALNFTKNPDDADDLIQDTLLKATRFASSFDPGTNIKGWLFVIMKNTFINNYRKSTREGQYVVTEEEISSAQLNQSATINDAVSNFAMADIKKALDKLPVVYALPFIRYFEGYKYHEIAGELRIPVGTVKTRIHKARLALKKQLKYYKKD